MTNEKWWLHTPLWSSEHISPKETDKNIDRNILKKSSKIESADAALSKDTEYQHIDKKMGEEFADVATNELLQTIKDEKMLKKEIIRSIDDEKRDRENLSNTHHKRKNSIQEATYFTSFTPQELEEKARKGKTQAAQNVENLINAPTSHSRIGRWIQWILQYITRQDSKEK